MTASFTFVRVFVLQLHLSFPSAHFFYFFLFEKSLFYFESYFLVIFYLLGIKCPGFRVDTLLLDKLSNNIPIIFVPLKIQEYTHFSFRPFFAPQLSHQHVFCPHLFA